MKTTILAVFISMMMSSAYADEEIQLAAVMSASDSSTLTANKKLYAIGDARSGGGFRSGTRSSNFDYAVIGGVVVVLLGVIAEGGAESASNH